MQFVEFFGLSGAGKTAIKDSLKKKFIDKKIKVYDYKGIILKFSQTTIKLSTKEKLTLKYFKFIKSKHIKKIKIDLKKKNKKYKNYFNILESFNLIYRNICLTIFKKFKKRNRVFVNYVIKTINNSNYSNKQKLTINNWFIEECSAIYLAKKNKDQIDLILDSEGFIQRSMLYFCYEKNQSLSKKIKKYITYCPLPNIIFYLERKIAYLRKIQDDFFNIPIATQKKIFDLIYYYLKRKILKENLNVKLIKLAVNKKNFVNLHKIKKEISTNIN